MEIKEKTNIKLYFAGYGADCFILSRKDDILEYGGDEYLFILPWDKAFAHDSFYQGKFIEVYVEKIDLQKKHVYVSQTHWLWMKNMIKSELGLDIKITKRYPGKVTVCKLVNQGQIINKAAVKRLSEMVGEKIYVKSL